MKLTTTTVPPPMTLTSKTTLTTVTILSLSLVTSNVSSVLIFVAGSAERTATGRTKSLHRTLSMTHTVIIVVITS